MLKKFPPQLKKSAKLHIPIKENPSFLNMKNYFNMNMEQQEEKVLTSQEKISSPCFLTEKNVLDINANSKKFYPFQNEMAPLKDFNSQGIDSTNTHKLYLNYLKDNFPNLNINFNEENIDFTKKHKEKLNKNIYPYALITEKNEKIVDYEIFNKYDHSIREKVNKLGGIENTISGKEIFSNCCYNYIFFF